MNSINRSIFLQKKSIHQFYCCNTLNIILDPIFIFVLGLGVGGAALASVIASLVSAALTLQFLFKNNIGIMLHHKYMRFISMK